MKMESDQSEILESAKKKGKGLVAIRRLIEAINDAHAELSESKPNNSWDPRYRYDLDDVPLSLLVAKEIGLVDDIFEVEVDVEVDAEEFETTKFGNLDFPMDWDFMDTDVFIKPEFKKVYEKVKPVYLEEVKWISDDTERADCLEDMIKVWLHRQTFYFKDVTVSGKTGNLIFSASKDYGEDESNPIEMYNLHGIFFVDDKPVATVIGDIHYVPTGGVGLEPSLGDYMVYMDEFSDHDADFAAFIVKEIADNELGLECLTDLYYEEGEGNSLVVKWRGVQIDDDMTGLISEAQAFDDMTDIFEENFGLIALNTVEKLAYQGMDQDSPDFDEEMVDVFPEYVDPFNETANLGMVACVSEIHRIGLYMNGVRGIAEGTIEDFILKSAKYHVMLNEFINRKKGRVRQGLLHAEGTEYVMAVLNPNRDSNPDLRLGQVINGHYF